MSRTESPWETGVGGTYIQTIGSPNGYDILINGTNKYLNFNTLVGASGYGFRDNGGIIEFKNSGGSWSPMGGSATSPTSGTVNGTNQTFVFTSAPSIIFRDGVAIQKVSSDGTVNWTGTTTITLLIAPIFDIFGL